VTDEFIRDLRRRVDLIALTLARLAQFSVDIDPMAWSREMSQKDFSSATTMGQSFATMRDRCGCDARP
jgi:hypothetical protein